VTGGVALASGATVAQAQQKSASADAPQFAPSGPQGRSFDFLFDGSRASVMLYLDGKGPFRFALDSGAALSTVSHDLAVAQGWPMRGATLLAGGAGGRLVKNYNFNEILIGRTFRVQNVNFAESAPTSGSIKGSLPLIMFPQSRVDFVARKVTVFPTRVPAPADMEITVLPHGPLSTREHRPILDAKLDGKPIRVLVDTGFTESLMLSGRYVERHGLWNDKAGVDEVSISTLTGGTKGRRTTCKSFVFGASQLSNLPVLLNDPKTIVTDAVEYYDAVVGMEILRRYDLWIDGDQKTYGIKPNALLNDVTRIDRSGMVVDFPSQTADNPVVLSVKAGGPAAKAGLKVGDEVRGFSTSDGGSDIADLHWTLKGPPGSKVVIKISRGGAEQTYTVVLEEAV
jgi:hypothetical protein